MAQSSVLAECILLCAALMHCPASLGQGQKGQIDATSSQAFREATKALRESRLDEAAAAFEQLTKSSPRVAEAHFNLGLVREEQGKHEEAIASLQSALRLRPNLRGANLFLGIAEYRLNRFDEAVLSFRKEIVLSPSDPNAWMWLGVAQLAKNEPEGAAESLDKAAKLAPENVDILYHRGRAHFLVSNNSYEQMFKTDPGSWRVHQVLAQADAEAERHDGAIEEYKAAIDVVPNEPGLHEELGTEYWKAGKLPEAAVALRRELEIDPNNVLARYKFGVLEVERGEGAESKESLEAALKQDPSLKDSAYYLGRAEMELGANDAAIDAFLHEIAAPNSTPGFVQQAWYQLGIIYRRLHRLGDAQKALATFQRLKDEETQRQQQRFQKIQKKREEQGPS